MNRVVLVGRLARDPNELRRSMNNVAVISFTIAVDNRSKKEDDSADYISCVAFNKTAEFVDNYFKKGLLVGIDGRLQTRNYDDKNGNKVYVTEVVCENVQILQPKGTTGNYKEGSATFISDAPVAEEVKEEYTKSAAFDLVDDSDLPF